MPPLVVVEIDTSNRKQVQRFLDLPQRVYRGIPQWVPPLAFEVQEIFDRAKNPFYKHSEAAFFMVEGPDGEAVGRIAVLDNQRHNDYNNEKTAFFNLFECMPDAEVAHGLFEAAMHWARSRGLNKMIGPKGFTPLDGLGLLVKGFEHRPAFGIPYNPEYYIEMVEAAGFTGYDDILSGYLNRKTQFPEALHQMSAQLQEALGLRVARFTKRGQLKDLIPKLHAMHTAALEGTTGNVPLTEEEIQSMVSQMMWFADLSLIKIIMHGDDPVGFLFAYPDVSEAVQRAKGRLLPFGWLNILRALHTTEWLNINGAGIIKEFRGKGATAILFSELCKSLMENRFEHADIVQISSDNKRMLGSLRDIGIDFYKTHRLYERALTGSTSRHSEKGLS